MAKFKKMTAVDFADYDFVRNPLGVDIYEARRQMAKVVNERMRSLERAKSKVTGETFDYGAYTGAKSYLEERGRKRFSESLQRDLDSQAILPDIAKLQRFLRGKSSTIRGMRGIEAKRIATFKEKGIPDKIAASKDFYDFLKAQEFGKNKGQYDSETMIEDYVKAVGDGKSQEDILKAFEDYRLGQKAYKELVQELNALPVKGAENLP